MTEDDSKPYKGPERRKEQRRKKNDRREEIRFELDKEDRRKGAGRRKSDRDGNLWKFTP